MSQVLFQDQVSTGFFNFFLLLSGNEAGQWFLDLKNGAGSCGKGEKAADVTFSMNDGDFHKMFSGIQLSKVGFLS